MFYSELEDYDIPFKITTIEDFAKVPLPLNCMFPLEKGSQWLLTKMSPLHPWRPQLHCLTAGLIKSSRQKITTAVFIDAKGAWIEHFLKRQLERNMVAYICNPYLAWGEAKGLEIQGKSAIYIRMAAWNKWGFTTHPRESRKN